MKLIERRLAIAHLYAYTYFYYQESEVLDCRKKIDGLYKKILDIVSLSHAEPKAAATEAADIYSHVIMPLSEMKKIYKDNTNHQSRMKAIKRIVIAHLMESDDISAIENSLEL